MPEEPPLLDPNLIYSLYLGVYKPQTLRIALLLDVFSPLADGPASAVEVARSCECDKSAAHALLDYLTCLELLDRQGDTYALTSSARTFLLPASRTYVGDLLLAETDPDWWAGILQGARSGQPSSYDWPWVQDAWLRSYNPKLIAKGLAMWAAAGIAAGEVPSLRVLDLACGCAVKSLVLAQADPSVRVVCVDSAEVLEVARDLALRLDVLPQVEFWEGDIHAIALEDAGFDAALLGQISFYLTPEQDLRLFQRIYPALCPGGLLLIDALMTGEQPAATTSFFNLITRCGSGGAIYSFAEYQGWLARAGFEQIKQVGETWTAARRGKELDEGRGIG